MIMYRYRNEIIHVIFGNIYNMHYIYITQVDNRVEDVDAKTILIVGNGKTNIQNNKNRDYHICIYI